MASVWLAQDGVLERHVAVKVLSDTIASDPDFLARFRREARVAAGISHPNLIGVYDYSDGDEQPFLVMEYVAGDDLAQRVSRGAAIDCERLARELLGAVAHIHGAGILHRDIKPQNVLIGLDGSAKLIDFGIALPADATSLTNTGLVLGTARFIAPEVMRGGSATERSDLYSCGVVLRDCLDEEPATPLRALVASLTANDPRDRPASAEAALAEIGAGRPKREESRTEALPRTEWREPTERLRPAEPRGEEARSPRRSRPARVAAAAAILVVFAAGAAALFADRGSEGPADVAGPAATAKAEKEREPGPAPEPEPPAPEDPAPEPTGEDPALGSALNDEGFELIQAGRPEEAVPVLEQAVGAFPPGSDELEYGYALFNLGNALRLSGRPEEAIPVLEQRLLIPDQLDVVRRELAAAESEAAQ